MNKKIFLKTFGCQMNIRDSEFVTGILREDGFGIAASAEEADVVLFNSCSVRKHAEDKLFSNIANLNELKRTKPGLVIGLIGCTAQNYKEEAIERVPALDLVCGPGNESDLPKIIKDVLKNRCPIIATGKVNEKRPELFPSYRGDRFKAYVSISEGCDNFCSYCIVPYVRGQERSRDLKAIVKEMTDLARRGFKEVTLIGQNVNSYSSSGRNGFVKLLEAANRIKGIERIRFMTSHPKDASIELLKAMGNLERVCAHLHLPIQSGSDRILRLMKRNYTQKRYLKLVEDYKRLVPEGSITTDIIVGFPSEREEDFNNTLNLMKEIEFDSAFLFKYSPRPPAESSQIDDNVPKEEKEDRLKILLDIQCEISKKRNEPMLGRVLEVLVDGQSARTPTLLTGRTRSNKIAVFEGGRSLIGELVDVEIESITPHALKGRMAA